ncbi:MAG: extracellular solute-binding protein [Dehalococcoidia bacterium]|nr:extracellular solute-binding protein [Dehalococcoidia bacterium]
MKGKLYWLMALSVLASVMVLACAPAAPPAAKPTAGSTAAPKEAAGPSSKATAMDQVIEGARREGVVKAALFSSLGDKGAKELIEALNKKYGLSLKMEFTPVNQMPAMVSQVITEIQTGGEPSWDVIMATWEQFMPVVERQMLPTFDWTGTFSHIPKEALAYDGRLVLGVNDYILPAYNPNVVKAEDVPRRWEDLLDPKWKGKIVVQNSTSLWIRLTEGKGEESVTKLLGGLAKQDLVWATMPQILPRLTSGEVALASGLNYNDIFKAQEQGAPARYAEAVTPVLLTHYGLGVPTKAVHPNAAKLLVAFIVTPEGARVLWDNAKAASRLVPGTPAADFARGKDLLLNTVEFTTNNSTRLDEKYRNILGLK